MEDTMIALLKRLADCYVRGASSIVYPWGL